MSCIDLIFCNKRNVISKYGVDASIFDKCHHNISYGKTDICVPLPPKYVREIWDYSKADVQNIKKSIKDFNWRKTFESLSVDSKVDLLNERLLNIFWNYVTNKKIECDYRQPLWMTNSIKRSLKESFKLTKCYYKSGQKKSDYEKLLEKSSDCTKQILEAKNNYVLKVTTKLQVQRLLQKRAGLFQVDYFTRKKFQQYHLYLLMVNFSLIVVTKQIFLITFLRR